VRVSAQFFEALEGKRRGFNRYTFYDRNDKTLATYDCFEDEDIEDQLCATIVAAPSGYLALKYYAEDDVVAEYPIVAWRCYARGAFAVEPVVIGADSPTTDCVVQSPDGRVVDPSGGGWSTREDWLADLRARAPAS